MPVEVLTRASAPRAQVTNAFGPLAELAGDWRGHGFNLISLPDFDPALPSTGPKPFRLKLNATFETLEFTRIGGAVPNRGSEALPPAVGGQLDVNNFGVTYLQKINDAVTINPLHIETGMWLLLPPSTDPAQPNQMLARLSAIPHGDSLMAQGAVIDPVPAPIINPVSSTPTLNPAGPALTRPYLDPFFTTPLPPGLPPEWIQGKTAQEIIANPNLLLQGAIADEVNNGQRIIQTEVLEVSTTIADNPTTAGIFNVPFVQKNANAASLTAIFWIETVQQADGSTFLQLQYTQTVILNFLGIDWPHISVATLIKQ